MLTSKEAYKKAMEYSPDREDLRNAFIAGIQCAQTGKYYKQNDIFITDEPVVGNIPTFDEWWNAYGKKCGRKKSEAKWNKLSSSQKIACMNATPAYVDATYDKKFRKDPLTYLNGECWNDELIFKQSNENQRAQLLAEKAARILSTD